MILTTKSGAEYSLRSDSTPYIFIREVHDNVQETYEFLEQLTDDELIRYTLSDVRGSTVSEYGHLASMNIEREGDHYVAKYYITRRIKTPDDTMIVIRELQAELAESNEALDIIFGEEKINEQVGESEEAQTDN